MAPKINLFLLLIDRIIFDHFPDDLADIGLICHFLEDRGNPRQFCVLHVVIPGDARNSILRLEQESNRRVVNDDYVGHRTAQPRQVLDKGIVEVRAMLAEEFVPAVTLWVQLLHQGLGVLRQTGGEHNQLVVLGHTVEELANARSDEDVNLTDLALDLDRQDDVWVLDLLELGVHQSLIKVEHKSFAADHLFRLRANQPLLLLGFFGSLLILLLLLLLLPHLLLLHQVVLRLSLLHLSIDLDVLLSLGHETGSNIRLSGLLLILLGLVLLHLNFLTRLLLRLRLLHPLFLIIHQYFK